MGSIPPYTQPKLTTIIMSGQTTKEEKGEAAVQPQAYGVRTVDLPVCLVLLS